MKILQIKCDHEMKTIEAAIKRINKSTGAFETRRYNVTPGCDTEQRLLYTIDSKESDYRNDTITYNW